MEQRVSNIVAVVNGEINAETTWNWNKEANLEDTKWLLVQLDFVFHCAQLCAMRRKAINLKQIKDYLSTYYYGK